MKLLIFGVTGGTGRQLVEQALAQGHDVTAFARNPAKLTAKHERLRVIQGNIFDGHAVDRVVAGQDAALCALGNRFRWWSLVLAIVVSQVVVRTIAMPRSLQLLIDIGFPVLTLIFFVARTAPVVSQGTKNIVCAMEMEGVKRFVCESSLGVGDSKGQGGWFFTYVLLPLLLRHAFADKEVQEKVIQGSTLDWVIVRPGALTNGPRTGTYKTGFDGADKSLRIQISRADVADFMLRQVTDSTYLRKTPGISY